MLTKDSYVDNKGNVCPACESKNLDTIEGTIEICDDQIWVGIECQNCLSTWTDTYQLTGYCYLEIGQGVD